jgi:hypothetical protein
LSIDSALFGFNSPQLILFLVLGENRDFLCFACAPFSASMGDPSECHGALAQLGDVVLAGAACLGIADAKALGCEAELTFGVAELVDSSAAVKIPGAGCDLENVELPSSAGKVVDDASSDASG